METQAKEQKALWGPVAAVVVTVGAYFLSQLVIAVLIALVPFVLGWDEPRLDRWLSTSAAQFVTVVLVEAVIIWLLWTFLRSRQASWRSIGLVKPRVRDIGYVVAGFGAYFVVALVVLALIPSLFPGIDPEQPQELGFDTATTGPALALVFTGLVMLPAIVEEIVARGFLFTGLRSKLSFLVAALTTSSLFAVAHLQLGSGNAPLWMAAADTFVLSMILVFLREKTGSLWSPIGVHLFKNSLAFVYLLS